LANFSYTFWLMIFCMVFATIDCRWVDLSLYFSLELIYGIGHV